MLRTAWAALEGGWFEGNVKRPAAQSLRAAGVKANFIASAQNGAIIAAFVESVCHLFFRCKNAAPGGLRTVRPVCGFRLAAHPDFRAVALAASWQAGSLI